MPPHDIDHLELFMCIDAEDSAHEIPDTILPAPRYFVRSTAKPMKGVLRLEAAAGNDDEPKDNQHQHVSDLKAAMGRELTLSWEKHRWTVSKSRKANDEWDRILDLDTM